MKKKMKSLGLIIGIGLLALVLFGFKGDGVKAADDGVPTNYAFYIAGKYYSNADIIPINNTDGIDIKIFGAGDNNNSHWEITPDSIDWDFSDKKGVIVGVEYKEDDKGGIVDELRTRVITANGPGYSSITATIKYGDKTFPLTAILKVELDIDYNKTTDNTVAPSSIIELGPINKKEVFVLFDYDYDKNENEGKGKMPLLTDYKAVDLYLKTFNDKTAKAYSFESIFWKANIPESNKGVIKVDNGQINVLGSGSTTIDANVITELNLPQAELDTLKKTIKTIVVPSFKIGNQVAEKTTEVDHKKIAVKTKITTENFTINSNALSSDNLIWEVIDHKTGKAVDEKKMQIFKNYNSGDVTVANVKAGTYTIFAYPYNAYKKDIPHAAMTIEVPVMIKSEDVVLNVGDVYELLEGTNSNLHDAKIVTVKPDNPLVVSYESEGVSLRGLKRGSTIVRITINDTDYKFENNEPGTTINVNVIDGISLNISRTTMFVGSKLRLEANVTDPYREITWDSSNKSLATVDEDGVVTALKVGEDVRITATVKIGGVTKKATAIIDIVPSITKIEITPENVNLKLQEEATLIAKLTPANIKGVELVWKSSNDKVVDFVKTDNTSARIIGKTSGTAVITATNKDNIVMGYAYVTVAQPVTGITLSDTKLTMRPNSTHQLHATIKPDNATNKELIWRTSDPAIATVDKGLVKALKVGVVRIYAVSAEDETIISKECEITVEVPVTGINIKNKTIYMNVGGTDKIDYEILPANANDKKVTFTSTNPSVATVDANGNLKGINQGMAVILVRTDSGHLEYATVFVTQQATDIIIDAKDVFLKSGQTYDVKVTYIPAGSASTRILWESTNLNVVTVDQNGKLTAKDPGTAIVIARTETGRTAFINVHVVKGLTGITITPLEKELFIGEEFQYNLTFIPADATHQGVKWTSSNTSVASIDEATGKVKALKAGSTIITAISTEGNHKVIAMLTVKELATTIELNHTSYRLGLNTTFTLEATIASSVSNQKIRWTSSNPSVATVNQNGKVTGKKLGKATITAIAQDGSLVSASCNVEVVRKATKITMNKPFVSLSTGKSETLKTIITPKNTTYKGVKWSSSDESIVAVDANGRITGIQIGRAVITATIKDDPSMKAVANVEVVKYEPPKKPEHKPITSITVPNQKITMLKGEKVSVKAAVRPVDTSEGYSWSSNSNSIATVNKKTGMITAKSTGVATITVMADSGAAANIEVTVIGLDRTSMQLVQYSTDFIMIEGYRGSVNWYSENPSIATVSGGKIISRSPGTTNIVAVVNGKKLVCRVTVRKG